MHFLDRAESYNPEMWHRFKCIGGKSLIISDESEWETWNRIGDSVVHIELRRWADVVVVAPASADLLAKMSSGIADTLLLCVLRAWSFSKPCIICPAMNTVMWNHPVTENCIKTLRGWGYKIVGPVVKTLACNDTGNGAMASVRDIVSATKEALDNDNNDNNNNSVSGKGCDAQVPWIELFILLFLLISFYCWYLYALFDGDMFLGTPTLPPQKKHEY